MPRKVGSRGNHFQTLIVPFFFRIFPIYVMGHNFQSQTRIAGFISEKDVILGAARAIAGSAGYILTFCLMCSILRTY